MLIWILLSLKTTVDISYRRYSSRWNVYAFRKEFKQKNGMDGLAF
jgi:hypothetical protein